MRTLARPTLLLFIVQWIRAQQEKSRVLEGVGPLDSAGAHPMRRKLNRPGPAVKFPARNEFAIT